MAFLRVSHKRAKIWLKTCQKTTWDFQSYQLDSKKWFEYTTWNSNIERTLIKGQLMEYKKKTYCSKCCFIMRNLLLSVPSVKLLFGQSKVLKNTIWQSMQTITTKVKNVPCVQKLFWLRLPWIATLIKCTKIQVIFYEIGALFLQLYHYVCIRPSMYQYPLFKENL